MSVFRFAAIQDFENVFKNGDWFYETENGLINHERKFIPDYFIKDNNGCIKSDFIEPFVIENASKLLADYLEISLEDFLKVFKFFNNLNDDNDPSLKYIVSFYYRMYVLKQKNC